MLEHNLNYHNFKIVYKPVNKIKNNNNNVQLWL